MIYIICLLIFRIMETYWNVVWILLFVFNCCFLASQSYWTLKYNSTSFLLSTSFETLFHIFFKAVDYKELQYSPIILLSNWKLDPISGNITIFNDFTCSTSRTHKYLSKSKIEHKFSLFLLMFSYSHSPNIRLPRNFWLPKRESLSERFISPDHDLEISDRYFNSFCSENVAEV